MPTYDFECDRGHVTELRASMDTEFISCQCGLPAARVPVYRDQHMIAETGPKGGRKNETPREEKSYRREFEEFREASAEVDYAYGKAEVKPPNFYKEGVRRARKQGAKVR